MEVSGGSKKFKDIRGAGRRNLLAGIAFVVGTLSMVGIPFTSGFVSKMCFAEAALGMSSKMIPTLVVLSISTLLNALYYIPAIMVVFANTGDEVTLFADKKDVAFMVSMIVFMALNFVLGCGSGKIIDMITQGIRMLG